MSKWKWLPILVIALCVVTGDLDPVSNVSASTNGYTLDWCVVGGGGNVSTRLNSTVGQTAAGWSTGANQLGSGFWYGIGGEHKIYLPLVLRNHS